VVTVQPFVFPITLCPPLEAFPEQSGPYTLAVLPATMLFESEKYPVGRILLTPPPLRELFPVIELPEISTASAAPRVFQIIFLYRYCPLAQPGRQSRA